MTNYTFHIEFQSRLSHTVKAESPEEAEQRIQSDFKNKILEPHGEHIASLKLVQIDGEDVKKK